MTKPAEPIYVAQTAEPMTAERRRTWCRERWDEAKRDYGCTWVRITIHETGTMVLVEGWLTRPAEEGAPRWMLVPADA